MNVWLITIGEILPIKEGARKGRTAHLADALLQRGHRVVWWTSAFDHFKKEWVSEKDKTLDLSSNFSLKLMRGLGYKNNFSLSRFLDHKILASKFKKLSVKEEKPDIIVASFPSYELAFEAVDFGRKNKIPVIVDVRDEWPDIFFEFIPAYAKPLAKILLWNDFATAKKCFKQGDYLTSMLESSLDWAMSKAGRQKTSDDRIFYLGAEKMPKPQSNIEKFMDAKKSAEGKFTVVFIGNFNEFYNPVILVEAAKLLQDKDIYFILGGDGIYCNKAMEMSRDLKNVFLPGWVAEKEISFILSLADVGVIPCSRKIKAFPNKAFTYFSAGLPVISSVDGELKKIIEEKNLGLYYNVNDASDLAGKIKTLQENSGLCREMGKNTEEVFENIFDSDKIYKQFVEYLENILKKWKQEKK